jgi:hypothetical protein
VILPLYFSAPILAYTSGSFSSVGTTSKIDGRWTPSSTICVAYDPQ